MKKIDQLKKRYKKEEVRHDKAYEKENTLHEKRHWKEEQEALETGKKVKRKKKK
jgi:hypothetical protein